jgi:hypothetical protein
MRETLPARLWSFAEQIQTKVCRTALRRSPGTAGVGIDAFPLLLRIERPEKSTLYETRDDRFGLEETRGVAFLGTAGPMCHLDRMA